MAEPKLNRAQLRQATMALIKPRGAVADDLAAMLASEAIMARGSAASAFRFALRSDADPGAFGRERPGAYEILDLSADRHGRLEGCCLQGDQF